VSWLNKLSRELDEELEFHLEARTRDNVNAGMTPKALLSRPVGTVQHHRGLLSSASFHFVGDGSAGYRAGSYTPPRRVSPSICFALWASNGWRTSNGGPEHRYGIFAPEE
jgi:hypothetical protein